MRIAYLDCFCGISGDMAVGALVDAGADFAAIRAALDSLGLRGFTVNAAKVNKHGIMATQFQVQFDAAEPHPHRHLADVLEIIDRGDLPAPVKAASVATFEALARAEAAVHGTTLEVVHFHEVGAVDSIVDIVAAQHAKHLLGVDRVAVSPMNVGSGTVQCDHGVLPVPAPATALLLQGKLTCGGDVAGELVTPTGAALVAQWAAACGPIPPMSVERIGYGSGTRDLPDRANVLRVFLGESASASAETQPILVVETNIDDLNTELFPPLLSALIEAGARDAFLTPIVGKKGRSAHCVTVLCEEAQARDIAGVLFRHSTTFGVRMRREERFVLERHWKSVATPWGRVRVKLGIWEGARTTAAPEFEDCRARAEAAGVPVRLVYEAALAAGLKGEFEDA